MEIALNKEPVHLQFHKKAIECPAQIAVERGAQRITYRQLDQAAFRLARRVHQEGFEKETPIAIYSADSCYTITAIIGILDAGCAFVPLDPEMPRPRLEHMVGVVKPRLFLVEAELAAQVEPLLAVAHPEAEMITFESLESLPLDGETVDVEWDANGMCYVYFTSGSTGEAKGIAGRMKGIAHFIRWESEAFSLGPGVRVSQLTLPSFDPFLRDCFLALCNGGRICVPDHRETVLDPQQLLNWLDKSQVEIVHCVPTLFRAMLEAKPSSHQLQTLRCVFLAGEVLPPQDCKAWFDIFRDRIQLINLYGPSETTMTKFFHPVTPADCSRKSIPIGQPMPGSRALLMDARMKACPPKTVGEIYLRTPFRSLGYINRPDLTEKVFIANPFSDNPTDLIYKTGDFARIMEDGNYEFLGRMDNQVKIRGVRIEPMEIESILTRHSSVMEGVVAGRTVGKEQQLVAYLVGDGAAPDINELRTFLQDQLPKAMVPGIFVVLDQLPRTLQGKIDRKALPAPQSARETTAYVAPRTPTEELICAIWADVLNQERVGVYDNFFALGGHSLLATQVVVRLRETFHVEIRLTKIFSTPTVILLAAFIETQKTESEGLSAPVPVDRSQDLPLSYAQQQLWFMDQLSPGSASFNLPMTVRLQGPLELDILNQCLNQMVRRHETLRTVYYSKEEGHPLQRVLPFEPQELKLTDLSHLDGDQLTAEVHRLIHSTDQTSFNLAKGPLLRVQLLREREDCHVMQMIMHHIASDGWSLAVFFREFITIYKALVEGREATLPELSIQYADYAHWQRQWLDEARVEQELAFWRETLADAPEITGLPCDQTRPEQFTHRGTRTVALYDKELVAALKRLGRNQDATLYMVLSAGFLAVLRWTSGSDDLVIGTDVANRQHQATEGVVGCFINQVPLRVQSAAGQSFKTLLAETRESFLGAYAHQDLPFIKLVESLCAKQTFSHGQIFQTKLVLQPPALSSSEDEGSIKAEMVETEHVTAQLDLILNLVETNDGLAASLEYCTDLYEKTTISQFLEHLRLVWTKVCAEPELSLDQINALLDEDLQERRLAQRRQEKQDESARLHKFRRTRGRSGATT